MAKKELYQLTFNLSEKEIQNFLEVNNLMECFEELSIHPKIESVYLALYDLDENMELPRTMQPNLYGKYKHDYTRFTEFQKIFHNYLMRSIMMEHILQHIKNPLLPNENVTRIVLETKKTIFERCISIAFAELSNEINLKKIEYGYQPFDWI